MSSAHPERTGQARSLFLGAALLVSVSPAILVVAAISATAIATRERQHKWWEIAGVATFAAGAVLLAEQLLTPAGFAAFHFAGIVAAVAGHGSWLHALLPTLPVAVPLGVAAGAAYAGTVETSSEREGPHHRRQPARRDARRRFMQWPV